MANAKKKKGPKGKVKVLKGGKLKIFQAVKGLVAEGKRVVKLIKAESPDILALGIAPEELEGLRTLLTSDEEYDPNLSNIDLAYAKNLAEFGKVEAPPPCFIMAVEVADQLGIEIAPLDIDIETHTDIYVKNVLFSDLFRQSMRFRLLKKKRFKIKTAEEFVLAWDKILNKAEGFSVVEQAREDCMAKSLLDLLDVHKGKNVFAVIEIERTTGVITRILRSKKKERSKRRPRK